MLLMFSVAPPVLVRVTTFAGPLAPSATEPHVNDVGDTVTVVPPPAVLTVRLTAVVWVRLPDTPVIVTVDVPVVAVALAVKVSVLLVEVGFGENAAVTPLGNAELLRVTVPLNPFTGFTETEVAPCMPCTTVTALGLAVRLKSGLDPATTLTTTAFDSIPLATT